MEEIEDVISESNMDVDSESGTQAEPVEHEEKLADEQIPISTPMNSGDGVQIFDSNKLDEIPCTSKSLTSRVKRRNRSFTEFEASRRILLPRSSKTRAYESLRNIAKPITPSKSTLGDTSAKSKYSRKSKNSGSVRSRPGKKKVGKSNGGYRQGSCKHCEMCAGSYKKRHFGHRESRMSFMSAGTSGSGGSASSPQYEECCRRRCCCHNYNRY